MVLVDFAESDFSKREYIFVELDLCFLLYRGFVGMVNK